MKPVTVSHLTEDATSRKCHPPPRVQAKFKSFFTGFLPARSPEGACQKELRPAPHTARLDADRGIDAPFVVGDAGDAFHRVDDGAAEEPERVHDGQRAAPVAFSSRLARGSTFWGARRGHRTSRRFDDGRKPRRTRRARRSRSGDIPVAVGRCAGGADTLGDAAAHHRAAEPTPWLCTAPLGSGDKSRQMIPRAGRAER